MMKHRRIWIWTQESAYIREGFEQTEQAHSSGSNGNGETETVETEAVD